MKQVTIQVPHPQGSNDALDLAVWEGGSGPVILAVHGMCDSKSTWRSIFEPLVSLGYRVAAIDMPGIGDSDIPDDPSFYRGKNQTAVLLSLMNILSEEPIVLMGSSLGTIYCTAAAQAHPERVAALILIGPPGRSTRVPPLSLVASWVRRLGPGMDRFVPWERLVRMTYRIVFHDTRRVPPEAIAESTRLIGSVKRRAAMTSIANEIRLNSTGKHSFFDDVWRALSLTKVPTLVLTGDHDRVCSAEGGRAVAHQMPDAVFKIIESCGHLPHLEQPQATMARLETFLAGIRRA